MLLAIQPGSTTRPHWTESLSDLTCTGLPGPLRADEGQWSASTPSSSAASELRAQSSQGPRSATRPPWATPASPVTLGLDEAFEVDRLAGEPRAGLQPAMLQRPMQSGDSSSTGRGLYRESWVSQPSAAQVRVLPKLRTSGSELGSRRFPSLSTVMLGASPWAEQAPLVALKGGSPWPS